MGFWRKVGYIISIVMIAGAQPLGQLKPIVKKQRMESFHLD
jgi:hypothetical protein